MVVEVTDKKITQRTFDRLVRAVVQAHTLDEQHVAVDLSNVDFVDPFGMVGLVLLSRRHKDLTGTELVFVLPEGRVRSYLGRAGFVRALLPHASLEPAVQLDWLETMDQYHGGASTLLEVTCLVEQDTIPPALKHIENALQDQLGYDKTEALDICIVVSEICHNAFEHNDREVVCYVAMQTYGMNSSSRFASVAVGDDGWGIPVTLRRNPKCTDIDDDWRAIVRSFELGVSQFDEPTRGNGLYHLGNLVLKHGGSLTVRSGRGKVRIRGDKGQGWPFKVPSLSGTQFAIAFPAPGG